jgi:hypothetical protein
MLADELEEQLGGVMQCEHAGNVQWRRLSGLLHA